MPQDLTSQILEEVQSQTSQYRKDIGKSIVDTAKRINPDPDFGPITFNGDALLVPPVTHVASEGGTTSEILHAARRATSRGKALLTKKHHPRPGRVSTGTGFLKKVVEHALKALD